MHSRGVWSPLTWGAARPLSPSFECVHLIFNSQYLCGQAEASQCLQSSNLFCSVIKVTLSAIIQIKPRRSNHPRLLNPLYLISVLSHGNLTHIWFIYMYEGEMRKETCGINLLLETKVRAHRHTRAQVKWSPTHPFIEILVYFYEGTLLWLAEHYSLNSCVLKHWETVLSIQ